MNSITSTTEPTAIIYSGKNLMETIKKNECALKSDFRKNWWMLKIWAYVTSQRNRFIYREEGERKEDGADDITPELRPRSANQITIDQKIATN